MLNIAMKPDRNSLIEAFLSGCELGHYQRQALAADASFRRYERITAHNRTYILMDAPPEHEDVRPFCLITDKLRALSLHAPAIFYRDEQHGFLLIEDLGTDSFTHHLHRHPEDEASLYRVATDALIHLHHALEDISDIPAYDAQAYREELHLFAEWFLPAEKLNEQGDAFMSIWSDLLRTNTLKQNALVLRDYHADNLMWLPDASGLQRLGLLDYQDALLGDCAYDLVSLLKDARRDIAPNVAGEMIDYYIEQTNQDADAFKARYAILGAQRNCKIIGIFHRLHRRDNKPHYLDYLPRVWAHLANDLRHPALADLKGWLLDTLPANYTDILEC